jgi:hypothetical protein
VNAARSWMQKAKTAKDEGEVDERKVLFQYSVALLLRRAIIR